MRERSQCLLLTTKIPGFCSSTTTSGGFTNPILADPEGHIIAGHGRLQAARAMGLTELPVITLSGLSETQKRALRIADNKIALNAGWDLEILQLELGELGSIDVDIDLTLRRLLEKR